MSILALVGSRNPAGRTASAARAFLEGAAPTPSALVLLPSLDIQRCRQCNDDGWGICRTEGNCVIPDDFASLVDRLESACLLVFANPVYFGDLSESMRAFLDRLRRISRCDSRKASFAGKLAVGICLAGGGGGGAPSACLSLEKVLATCGFDVLDMIPVRRQNFDYKLDLLRTTARHLTAPK